MDIWDITHCSGAWKPDDGCKVWACDKSKLPNIPPYFQQTHRNAVAGRKLKKGKGGKVRSAIAEYKNSGKLQWNDVYHAKAVSVPLTDGTSMFPREQWCYESINGLHATLTTVHPDGLVTFVKAHRYNSYYDRDEGRCVLYGVRDYWERKVYPDGSVYGRSLHFEPLDSKHEGDVVVTGCSKGLEALIGTAIGTSYRQVGSYEVPIDKLRLPATTYREVLEGLIPRDAPWQSLGNAKRISAVAPDISLEYTFLLNENGLINGYGPLGTLQSEMVRQELLQRATFETMNAIMTTWDNGIQNLQGILELAKLLNKLKNGDFSSLSKKANDLWLQYRYVISTSILDAEEGVKAIMEKELREKIAAGGTALFTGQSFFNTNDINIICKCHMQVRSATSYIAEQLLFELDRWGMIPDRYLVWDMIPYSFIVDWFVPIGDALAVEDANEKFGQQFKVDRCMYSFAYTRSINGAEISNYSRWVSEPVIPLGFTYMVNQYGSTGTKTILKRIVDVWAITRR